jgi:lipopolysaccharide/colanic/teichoic acid biosynthesis glycosyltransferase
MPARNASSFSKRLFDVAASAVGLVVTSPVIAGLAVAVKATSPGPVFHTAQRIGREGVPFTLYKFRSMRVGAAGQGPGITAKGDSRITKVGKLLRKTKLDELPQLWNVLRGDMSLVGPRPEDPRYVATYTDAQRRILAWRPGITSPASVSYRDEESILAAADDLEAAYAVVMDEKIRIDLEYFEHASLWGDLRWIVRTFTAILRS